jgi:adenylosuccinate synthase
MYFLTQLSLGYIMIQHADIVIDLQAGDTGKGKVSHHLAKHHAYDYVLRFNGGANAGHTIYHNQQKVVTHQVPVGIFHGIPSIIGAGCVVNIPALLTELRMLEHLGFSAPLYVDKRCHVTTQKHLLEDSTDTIIGTTKQGIGPTYRDKYARTGVRIGDVDAHEMKQYVTVIDVAEFFFSPMEKINILCEGAQGFQIDIDWGDYPYVTSSHCTSGAVALNGVAPRTWRNVYGIMKAYETYSGYKTHYTDDAPVFQEIQRIGEEVGATTGRMRQVRWLHLDEVVQAMHVNDVTDLIINKIDVLEQVKMFGVVHDQATHVFRNVHDFKRFVETHIRKDYGYKLHNITWSSSPEKV